jgi:signal peptidase II
MTLPRRVRLLSLLCLIVCTVGCDQASKHIARTSLSHESWMRITGGMLEFRLAENPGSFLSLGAWLPEQARFALFTFGVGAGLVVLAGYLTSRARIGTSRFIGLSLIVAGGLGNFLDRILRHGLVTDFAVVHVGPFHTGIFNVADILIVAGTGVVLYSFGRKQNQKDRGCGEPGDDASVDRGESLTPGL